MERIDWLRTMGRRHFENKVGLCQLFYIQSSKMAKATLSRLGKIHNQLVELRKKKLAVLKAERVFPSWGKAAHQKGNVKTFQTG